jgi:hypothetical protein
MPKPATIPLGLQSYRRDLGFVPEVELVNLLIEKDEAGVSSDGVLRIQRPGLTPYANLPGIIQGVFQQDGVLGGARFAVAGGTLYSYDDLAYTTLGTVDGGPAVFAATYLGLYVLTAGKLYSWDGTTFAPIAMPDNRLIVDMDTVNSYLILGCADGRFYWLVPGATSIDALNFATAESQADGLRAVRRLVDEIWFFGVTTVEPWQATGDATAPFQRASGRVFDRGCASRDTVLRFDNSILWEGDDGLVYRSSAVPQRVSTTGIEERIRQATGDRSAWSFSVEGHKCYVLFVPGQGTWCYDAASSAWSEIASSDTTGWRARYGYDRVAASADSGEVWNVDPASPTDAGVAFRKAVSGAIGLRGQPSRNASASFSVGCSAPTTFRVRWRDADEAFPEYWEGFDVTGPAEVFSLYRMGQGREPYRVFEVENTDPVQVRFDGATVNGAWQ